MPRSDTELFRIKAGTGVMTGMGRDLSVSVGAAIALGLAEPPARPELTTRELVYLIGAPGVGKSTLMDALTRQATLVASIQKPFRHIEWGDRGDFLAAELGGRRRLFSGTDMLAFNAQPRVIEWMSDGRGQRYQLVLGEGDRLGNVRFLDACRRAGWLVHLVDLYLPDRDLDLRHAARGMKQNDAWRRGRATKARNVARWAREAGIHTWGMSAGYTPGELADRCRDYIPILRRLT